MSTKRRQRSVKSESGSGSLSSRSQSRQSPQVPGSSDTTGGTTSTRNEGCLKCGKDDNHSHLLLCEACNDEYHTHCLDPPLDYVPEGDFFCGKYRISRSILLLPTASYSYCTVRYEHRDDYRQSSFPLLALNVIISHSNHIFITSILCRQVQATQGFLQK